jgi:hypothetical protein
LAYVAYAWARLLLLCVNSCTCCCTALLLLLQLLALIVQLPCCAAEKAGVNEEARQSVGSTAEGIANHLPDLQGGCLNSSAAGPVLASLFGCLVITQKLGHI